MGATWRNTGLLLTLGFVLFATVAADTVSSGARVRSLPRNYAAAREVRRHSRCERLPVVLVGIRLLIPLLFSEICRPPQTKPKL